MAKSGSKYSLTVPLDASGVEDREGAQDLKVVARDRAGGLHATTAKIGKGGTGKATFEFAEDPGALHIAVGPAEATDEEVLGLQTLAIDVTERAWAGKTALEISPLVITPYYWWWWWRWCRQFTIRGRVVCPDGSPVPGAEVCAYDVDWWFFWSSKQLIGCAQTAIDGTFELKFRWCCGWWPWWWWRLRVWQLEESLVERIGKALRVAPELELGRISSQPSLRVFDRILEDPAARRSATLAPTEIAGLPRLRERLVSRLPKAPELEALRIWPWYPWYPWWDCTPDVIFKVTQDCGAGNQVILEETVADTRWNIPNPLDVGLVVSDEACCLPPPCPEPPCRSLECLILDQVCGVPFSDVGGNPGAAATPEGYAYPGPVPANSTNHHRVFAGTIPIWKNPEDLVGFDYYELEYDKGLGWEPLPLDAAVDFNRVYWEFPPGAAQTAPFVLTNISGHEVVETRVHYENNHAPTWPNEAGPTNAWWLSPNYSLLALLDTTKIGDGTFRFRVIGWQEGPGPSLQNPAPIPVCGTLQDNEFVLTFNNRVISSATHPVSHNCGQGVHLCTEQPDTHILAVRVDGVPIDPCDTVDLVSTSTLEIDFLAYDSDGLLAFYDLYASWGLNQSHNLLLQPGAQVTTLGPLQTGYPAAPALQATGNYGTAVAQGATPPTWAGGTYRLTMPMASAFPDPCCYQLELRAFRRMIVGSGSSCEHGYVVGVNGNRTEYSIGVGVCPPRSDAPAIVDTIDSDRP